ncbi:MAG: hypothetical protein HZA54_18550, partial [Planctomycetes bacterium]|nr:hypothetical protein [Planctomycetota bacterium]
ADAARAAAGEGERAGADAVGAAAGEGAGALGGSDLPSPLPSPAAAGEGDRAGADAARAAAGDGAGAGGGLCCGVGALALAAWIAVATGCLDVGSGPEAMVAALGVWVGVYFPLVFLGLPARPVRLRWGLLGGIVAYLVHGYVDFDAYEPQVATAAWLAAGALVGLDRSGRLATRTMWSPGRGARIGLGVGLAAALLAIALVGAPLTARTRQADETAALAREARARDPYEEARLWEQVCELAPANPASWYDLSCARHQQCLAAQDMRSSPEALDELFARCLAALDAAREREGPSAALEHVRGLFLEDHARRAQAAAAQAQSTFDRQAWDARATAGFDAALVAYGRAVELYPARAQYRLRYGLLLREWKGDRAGARAQFRQALHASEENPLDRLRLAPAEAEALRAWLQKEGR